ncbi:hypothetical protein EJB05_21814, partial [Eragrostis curvula]
MVNGRDSRGWGREGFGAGRQGRGAGRTGGRQDYTWRREQEWIKKDEDQNPDQGRHVPNRDRWDKRQLAEESKIVEELQVEEVKEKSKWSHREEMMENSKQWLPNEQGSKRQWAPNDQGTSKQMRHAEGSSSLSMQNPNLECFRCGDKGHVAQDCTKPRKCDLCGGFGHVTEHCRSKKLWELVAPLCATQVERQSFFSIPDCPSDINLKERSTTAIVTVISGQVDARQIENEFRSILGGNNSSIGAKAELQQAWFRVRGIPFDKRSVHTLAYVGSLVGATTEVEGAIIPYLYNFHYEREVIIPSQPPAETTQVPIRSTEPSPKKPRIENSNAEAKLKGLPNTRKLMHDAQKGYSRVMESNEETNNGDKSKNDVVEVTSLDSDDDDDDLLSEEFGINLGGGDEANSSNQTVGLVKCVEINTTKTPEQTSMFDKVSLLEDGHTQEASKEVLSLKEEEKMPLPEVDHTQEASKQVPSLEEEVKIADQLVEGSPVITEAQKIKITRQSNRLQQQLMQQAQHMKGATHKRTLEGTNLNDDNSFSVLSNSDISLIANNMGITVNPVDFETVDIMKDLEIARHTILNKKEDNAKIDKVDDDVVIQEMQSSHSSMPLLLEWEKEDSEEEQFTLVKSRKKGKNPKPVKDCVKISPLRRTVWGIVASYFGSNTRPASYEQFWEWVTRALPEGEMIYMTGLFKSEMQEVIEAGATSMMQAAINVMRRQGRCIVLPVIRSGVIEENGDEEAARPRSEG